MRVADYHGDDFEALQLFYPQRVDDGDFSVASDLLFEVRRNFTLFPLLQRDPGWPRNARPDVYVIILDSTSRRAMRRFAPSIHSLFEKQDLPHHVGASFEGFHTVCGGGTLGTVYPMFHGGVGVGTTPAWCSEGLSDKPPWKQNYSSFAQCYNASRRILKLARDAGFVVSLSTNLLFQLYNDQDDPHHATCPALCDTSCVLDEECWASYDYANDMAKCSDYTCFGRDRYAKKILNFNEKVFAEYPDRPKFSVSMLHGAHRSPEDLEILEQDLLTHFLSILRPETSDFRNSVVILMGDHGHKTISCDYTTPFFGMLAPRSWSASPAGQQALSALKRNAQLSSRGMIHTPWDLYATLRHLISWDAAATSPTSDGDHFGLGEVAGYGEIQSHTEMHGRKFLRHMMNYERQLEDHAAFGRFPVGGSFRPRSLLTEMRHDRSCEEAGVAPSHCSRDVVPVAYFSCEEEMHARLMWQGFAQGIGAGADMKDERVMHNLSRAFPGVFRESDPELLVALLDANADGATTPLEVAPILGTAAVATAAAAGEAEAAASRETKAFWCASGISRVLQAISTMNRAYTEPSQGACRPFTLLSVDRVLVSRASTRGSRDSALSLSFTVGQGEPRSRYELTLVGRAEQDVPRTRWWKTTSLYALTRYHPYQNCTPAGSEAEFCVCK